MKKITLAVGLITVLSTTAMAQQTGQSQQTVRPGISGNSATINGQWRHDEQLRRHDKFRNARQHRGHFHQPARARRAGSAADSHAEKPAVKQRDTDAKVVVIADRGRDSLRMTQRELLVRFWPGGSH